MFLEKYVWKNIFARIFQKKVWEHVFGRHKWSDQRNIDPLAMTVERQLKITRKTIEKSWHGSHNGSATKSDTGQNSKILQCPISIFSMLYEAFGAYCTHF